MCTVTYLPISKSSFILTSNRDESQLRKIALPPEKYLIYDTNVYFPKDTDANGTWFAAAETKFTICLLNGASERHERHPPYRISRGLMLLDFFKYLNVPDFISQYNFDGIEPFTLLIFEQSPETVVYEARWDGKQISCGKRSASLPYIWSSAQLYPKKVIEEREKWFEEWQSKNVFTMDNIFRFHKTGGNGNSYTDLLMNRDGKVFTVSITSMRREEKESLMRYEDMISKKMVEKMIKSDE